ncbi:NADPH-dependent FMN reductase [Nocardioides caldifontis]|uniref:NADPH-dependent FMN reductase n=1 Tax=Nocardioides caldifontis TaxID=2588938 RepID=UPI0011DF4FD8|nr:NAD(P)H-dependent oxidoreductase [Nocardioides caldifontis]
MQRLAVVVASTRPTRVGLKVAEWFEAQARKDGRFEVDLVDLAEVGLPFMDEPNHPRLRQYVHQHTKEWSARVDAADAFAFVVAEYNYGMPAPLKNALDYLVHEWAHKAAGIVSYGGVSAGLRSAEMTRSVLTALQMHPVKAAVSIPMVTNLLDEDGELHATQLMDEAATALLDDVARVDAALRVLREQAG